MSNPIYTLLQSLPTNGWTTAIGGIGSLLFGIGGLLTGKLDAEIAIGFIIAGWTTLGIGSKLDKASK